MIESRGERIRAYLLRHLHARQARQREPEALTPAPGPQSRPIIAFDNFNRADDATALGTSVTGHSWSVVATNAVWGISNGQAYVVTSSTTVGHEGRNNAVQNVGRSDVEISVTVTTPASGDPNQGILVRSVDINNYLEVLLVAGPPNDLEVWKREGGGFTKLAEVNANVWVPSTRYQLKVECAGANLLVYLDNELRLRYTLTAAEMTTFSSATQHGMRVYNQSGTTRPFDDFTVRAAV